MKRHILYLSFDGLLEPLGYSQVVRYVKELSKDRGLRYTIASLEKDDDLRDEARCAALRGQLEELGIRWMYRSYANRSYGRGGGLSLARRNVQSMNSLVGDVLGEDKVDLIHARSYLSAAVALKAKKLKGVPYLFDIRGYWIDERAEEGRWFTNPVVYQAAKAVERRLFEGADGVVSLSRLAAEDIRAGQLGHWESHKPIALIPTCVDYDEFALGREPRPGIIPEAIAARLQGKLVVGFVGSVNAVYCIDEMVRLFGHLLDRRPDAHLLALTRQPEILEEKARAAGIPVEAFTLASAPHDEVADWLYYMDWGLMLRRRSFANRAAMPTKMAEFFARGVRPLQYGCNDEVCDWVNRAGSGLVMNSTAEFDLRQAADFVARSRTTPEMLARARWNTQTHFDLKSGIDRYAEVIERIVEPEKDKLSVLFLTEGKTVPASRFRVEQFIPHLEARGIRCTVRAGYDDRYNAVARRPILGKAYKLLWSLKRIPAAMDAQNFDLLFLQRPALPFSAWPEKFAASRNPRAIFDVDDAIFFAPDGGSDSRMQKTFEAAIKSSAHVICGNDFLAGYARPHGPTTVIPTVIDTERYRPGPARDEDEIVIGWMGTASNFYGLRVAVPALLKILASHPNVRVRLVSNAVLEELRGIDRVEQIPWSADQEISLLQSFDIGLMPLADIPKVYGKCGFKMIQYMAVGIPVVASAVGANPKIFEGSAAGFLIDDLEEWELALNRLVESPRLRKRMGAHGRVHVVENYSIDAVIDTYVELFERVSGRAARKGVRRGAAEVEPRRSALPVAAARNLMNLFAFF